MIESAAFRLRVSTVISVTMMLLSCRHHDPNRLRAAYVPLAQLESVYGRLITAGNHPTPNQNGTGDRVGLFLDAGGTIWGLPLAVENGGEVLGCAPTELRRARVTDTYPIGATILGATISQPGGVEGPENWNSFCAAAMVRSNGVRSAAGRCPMDPFAGRRNCQAPRSRCTTIVLLPPPNTTEEYMNATP